MRLVCAARLKEAAKEKKPARVKLTILFMLVFWCTEEKVG
jgi:hypothetical protein